MLHNLFLRNKLDHLGHSKDCFRSASAGGSPARDFRSKIFFWPKSFFLKKSRENKSFLIKSPPQAENFEDFSFKIVRKCFRNAFVSADFGSGSVKIFRLRRAFLLKK